ncbi:MAG: hypothetical protein GPJ54_18085 [Candidatus Heimdallarchaeota archaeon]|nr:hypothetical protein [Candidatus Heimdallarchaeota archaeon]
MNNRNFLYKIRTILICSLLSSIPIPISISASNYDVSWTMLPSLPGSLRTGDVNIGLNTNAQEIVLVIYDPGNAINVILWIYNIRTQEWRYQEISRSTDNPQILNPLLHYLAFNALDDKFYTMGYNGIVYELMKSENGIYLTDFVPILNSSFVGYGNRDFIHNPQENQLIFLNSQNQGNEVLLDIKIYDIDNSVWLNMSDSSVEFIYRADWGSFVFDPYNYEIMYRPLYNRWVDPVNYSLFFDLSSKSWHKIESINSPMDIELQPFVFHSGINKYVGMGGTTLSGGIETKEIWIYDPNYNEWAWDDGLHENLTRSATLMVYNPLDQQIYVFGGQLGESNVGSNRLFDLFSFSFAGSGFGETLVMDNNLQYVIIGIIILVAIFIALKTKRKNQSIDNA